MTRTFDPYYRWLGIPPHLQPPHHYRLLGLELFESDPEVIGVAADRQMIHVRMYQLGEYSEISQRLLNELATAKMCLLIPERKAAYDAELRKMLAAAPAPSPPARVGGDFGPAASDDEELELAPVEPSRESSHPPAGPQSRPEGAASLHRGSPSSLGLRKPEPLAAPLNPLPSFPTDELPPPNFSRTHEPPFMAEYRRNFFEKLMKAGIFLFLFALGLMLFNAFVRPWIGNSSRPEKQSSPAPKEPISKENAPSQKKAKDGPLPPPPPPPPSPLPPPNLDANEIPAAPEKAKPFIFTEKRLSTPPAPADKTPTAEKTAAQLRGEEFFVGHWRIDEDGRYAFSMTLQPDFTARDSRHPSLVGQWEQKNHEARVVWNDGWRIVLRREGDTVRKYSFAPDDSAEFHPLNEGTATKVLAGSEK
ncbi:MAG: hypothetical protein IT426_18460 [Pirellulales bacterium]|nr:hypothetical protein [Pirellulales bacterium]